MQPLITHFWRKNSKLIYAKCVNLTDFNTFCVKTNITMCVKKQTNHSHAFILYINCLLSMNHYPILGKN